MQGNSMLWLETHLKLERQFQREESREGGA